jgi:hypothetical protein
LFLIQIGLDDEEIPMHLPSDVDPNLMWPTMQDLNTRLRRVITSYQRNYKKEELKQQQKAKVSERLHSVHESRVFEVILYYHHTHTFSS